MVYSLALFNRISRETWVLVQCLIEGDFVEHPGPKFEAPAGPRSGPPQSIGPSGKVSSRQIPWLHQLPNQLTLARLAVVPFLLVAYPMDYRPLKIFCAFVFLAAALTDALDGWLARRRQTTSALGALLDPIADKALIAASLVLLANEESLWTWVIGLLLVRDIAISGIRMMALEQGFSIDVSGFGKLKTIAQGFMIFCLMINEPLWGWPFREVGWMATWISLFLSLYSGWKYCEEYLAQARQRGLIGKMFGG